MVPLEHDEATRARNDRQLLPAWFTERMMTDSGTFGLLLVTSRVLVIERIEAIRPGAADSLWLDVTLRAGAPPPGWHFRALTSPTRRRQATVNAAHVVAVLEQAGR